MRNYLFIFLVFWAPLCRAQDYEGTLGKNNIHVSLEIYANNVRAYYFYDAHLQNIALEGTRNDHKLMLYKKFTEPKDKQELFTLVVDQGKMSGTWKNGAKTLPVKLTKTSTDFEDLKQDRLEFRQDSVEKYGDREIVWFTEKYSKKSLFRLGNGFSKQEREFVNPKLDSIQRDNAVLGLDCDYAEINNIVELISNKYVSFMAYVSTYCGGVHPNHGIHSYNFDLQKKKEIDKISAMYPNVDWYELVKNKYKNDHDLQEECDYFSGNKEVWKYADWVLTEKGITIIPEFAHALTPCEIEFHLTYKELGANP